MAENELNVRITGKDELTPTLQSLESRLIRTVGAISSAIAGIKLATAPITSAATFERGLADVAKTTNFTKTEIKQLSDGLLQLSLNTDVSANDLAAIAAAAGQQGLGKEGVEGVIKFTDTVSRMASVLDITAEQAGADVGKILNIFKIPISEIENLSSAINLVSNNSTAKGRELLDILKRIGDGSGTLKNMQESLALAATGLDLGVSPEVIGTSFTRILSQMRSKSKEFAQVNKMTQEEWVKEVDKSGLQAYLRTLDRIRAMDKVSQSQTINTLFGQGRVYSLSGKGVQDTEDKLIQKNLALANAGYKSGTSAIKEQKTVMDTLVAQTKVLGNSLNKVAIQAGEPILQRLTGYVIELQRAFQGEKFTSFANAAVAALGDLAGHVANAARFVGSLEINWNNLVTVAKIFVEIKIGQFLLGLVSRFTAVGASATTAGAALLGFKRAQDAVNASQAAAGAGGTGAAAPKAAPVGVLQNVDAFKQALAERRAAVKAAADAEAELTRRQNTLDKARGDLLRAQAAEKDAATRKAQAEKNVSATADRVVKAQTDLQSTAKRTGDNLSKAQAAAATTVQAAQAAGNAKVMQAQSQHLQRMQALTDAYWAEGSTKTATRLRREEAVEKGRFAQRLAALQAANAAEIAAAQTAALRRVEIAEFEHKRVLAMQQVRVTGTGAQAGAAIAADTRAGAGVAAAGAGVAAASAAYSAAQSQAAAAAASAGVAQKAMNAAAGAATLFMGAMRVVGAALGFVLRALGPVAIGFSILYEVLSATGKLENAWAWVKKLGDILGFTSEEDRKATEQSRRAREELNQRAAKVRELVQAYRDFNDQQNGMLDSQGRLDAGKLGGQLDALKDTTDSETRVNLARQLSKNLEASAQDQAGAGQVIDKLPELKKEVEAEAAKTQKLFSDATKKLNELEQAKTRALSPTIADLLTGKITKQKGEVDKLKKAYEEAKSRADALSNVTPQTQKNLTDTKAANAKTIQDETLPKLFTDQSLPLLDALAKKKEAEARLAEAEAKFTAAKKKVEDLSLTDDGKNNTQLFKDALIDQARQEKAVAETALAAQGLRDEFDKVDKTIREMPNLNPNTILSLQFIKDVLGLMAATDVNNWVNAIARRTEQMQKGLPVAPLVGGGTGETKPPKANSGTEAGLPDPSAMAEQRALLKAKQALEEEQFKRFFMLRREDNEQLLAEDERSYARGLVALANYYKNKQDIASDNLDADINLAENEIKILRESRNDESLRDSDKIRIDAQIQALQNRVDVYKKQYLEINKKFASELELAEKQFTESILSDKLDIRRTLGFDDAGALVADELDRIASDIKFKVQRLEAELAAGRPGVTQALIDNLKLKEALKALDTTFQAIVDKATIAAGRVNNVISRINFRQSRGLMTDIEAERATNDANAEQAENVKQEIEAREAAITKYIEKQAESTGLTRDEARAVYEGTDAYKKQANEIERLKDTYVELRTVIDSTALSINQGIGDAITKLIESLGEKSTGKLREFFKNVNKIVLAEAQKMFVQDFVKSMGGTGGIGGFFSKLFNPQGVGGNQAGKPLDKEMLGRNAANAMYVQVTNGEKPKDAPTKEDKPAEKPVEKTATEKREEAQAKAEAVTPKRTNAEAIAYMNDPANRAKIMADAERIGELRKNPQAAAAAAKTAKDNAGKEATNPLYVKSVDGAAAGAPKAKTDEELANEPAKNADGTPDTDVIGDVARQAETAVTQAKTVATNGFGDILQSVARGFEGGGTNGALGALVGIFKAKLFKGLDGLAKDGGLTIEGCWGKITSSFTGSATKAGNEAASGGLGIGDMAGKLGTGLQDAFSGVADTATGIFGGLGDIFTNLFSGLGDSLSGLGSSLVDTVSSLFSSLAGAGGGGGGEAIGGLIASFFHTGGVAGETHGRHSAVSPLAFAGAIRYHTGGIAGLQPNEVPAILQKGEEVLTKNDARHRDNISSGPARSSARPVSVVIQTPDANSFRKSKDQVATAVGNGLKKAQRRNQ